STAVLLFPHVLSSHGRAPTHDLLSFPTRRSSDLEVVHRHASDVGAAHGMEAHLTGVDHVVHAQQPGRRAAVEADEQAQEVGADRDRKSTRLNSSHVSISYAVFCLKKKKTWIRASARSPYDGARRRVSAAA